MKTLKTLFAVAALTLATAGAVLAHGYSVGPLKIGHPFSKAMLPGQKVGGGFMKIENTGTADDRLVSVTSDRAPEVQIHEMTMENDVMKMRALPDGLAIPAGQTTELKPGGYHLMFMNVPEGFKEGEMIKATLTFEKAGTVDVEFKVDGANPKAEDHSKHGAAGAEDHTAH
ncbi:hypothetical protein SAMN05880582_10993 [Rhizobium sp. RU20A]|uniref:copper chaperone PCu(A)C n=1 Tax=Rhizobium sp. RU20A TaxID=1907412 RepID=UPI0009565AF1|nr:copper chaperone PCu(A)C [Rhizobium sp. RU20A]SIR28717.1 hypothetical protein SAMN05880582_10993 [Rhizobium sp. RU20A]